MTPTKAVVSMGSFSLHEAPTFRPTPAEFQDPLGYISSIRDQAERYGICKVGVPGGVSNPLVWLPAGASAVLSCCVPGPGHTLVTLCGT